MRVLKVIAGAPKVEPEKQMLYKDERSMVENNDLAECGLARTTSRVQAPAMVLLAFRDPHSEISRSSK